MFEKTHIYPYFYKGSMSQNNIDQKQIRNYLKKYIYMGQKLYTGCCKNWPRNISKKYKFQVTGKVFKNPNRKKKHQAKRLRSHIQGADKARQKAILENIRAAQFKNKRNT